MARTRCHCGGPVVTGEGFEVCAACSDTREVGDVSKETKPDLSRGRHTIPCYKGDHEGCRFPETCHCACHEERGCPCLYVEPCDERCSCVMPTSSTGCLRCCSYGNREQREEAARYLVRQGVKAALADWLLWEIMQGASPTLLVEEFLRRHKKTLSPPVPKPAAVTREPFEEAP